MDGIYVLCGARTDLGPALPFLHHTELLLAPCIISGVLWLFSLFGFNIPKHLAYIFVLGSGGS